jgi:hypothetical protein
MKNTTIESCGVFTRREVEKWRSWLGPRNHRVCCLSVHTALVLGAFSASGCAASSEEDVDGETVASVGQAVDNGLLYGTQCQQDFQNDWIKKLDGNWTSCEGFNSQMNNLAGQKFYYNLKGTKYWMEESGDQGRQEQVDLFYFQSHGGGWPRNGATPAVAVWTMYEEKTRAFSNAMRYGDESRGMSIFASYACDQMVVDGYTWERWYPIMSGGLRIATGGSGDMYSGTGSQKNFGSKFGANLRAGKTVASAWVKAALDVDSRNTPVALTTGTDEADCVYRRDNIKWSNFASFARRTAADIGYMCWRWWE